MHTPDTTANPDNFPAQTIEELEANINVAANKLGEQRYKLRPGMFRVYLNLEQQEVARMFGGPTVQIYLGVSPFKRDLFKSVLLDCLKNVEKLWHPVAISKNSYIRQLKEFQKKWVHDPEFYTPSYRLSDERLRTSTTYVVTVKVVDRATGLHVSVSGSKEGEWALREQAVIMLSRRVAEFNIDNHTEDTDGE